jgi:Flp pilus assembly protein TadD
MTGWRWLIPLGIAAFQLGGCTSLPSDSWSAVGAKRAFLTEHEQNARSYESRGSLALALREWLVISAVAPGAAEPLAEIGRLQGAIASRVEKKLREGKSALGKGRYADAELQFLKALALQPDNADAARELKALEGRRAFAKLAAAPKVSTEAVSAYRAPSPEPDDGSGYDAAEVAGAGRSSPPAAAEQAKTASAPTRPAVDGNLRLALQDLSKHNYEAALQRFALARKSREASDEVLDRYIADTRKILAERHYDEGVSAFRAARYDQAIVQFSKALEYEPGHQKAKLYLTSARELEVRLGQ